MEKQLVLKNGKKTFKIKDKIVNALNSVNLNIERGKFYVVRGHSGSGKTTLIQILGILDVLSSGELYINGENVSDLNDDEKANLRMKEIGFVFQSFFLNPRLNALENVILPMYINKSIKKQDRRKIAMKLLTDFGLCERMDHYPKELSGGEQQRIAIARALANNPNLILADEPTGNLDIENEKIVFELLKKLSKNGKAVVVVSHNEIVREYADEIYNMENGVLRREI